MVETVAIFIVLTQCELLSRVAGIGSDQPKALRLGEVPLHEHRLTSSKDPAIAAKGVKIVRATKTLGPKMRLPLKAVMFKTLTN